MYGNIDLEKRIEEQETYMDWKEWLDELLRSHNPKRGVRSIQNRWLYDLDPELQRDPTGRVMVVMPIILYEVQQGVLTVEMEGELYGTLDDLNDGLLDELPKIELDEIRKDLNYCIEQIESGKAVWLPK